MKKLKSINPKILIILIFILIAGYLTAFHLADCIAYIRRFDNLMSQDAAQIARNTIRGHILTTKYITPASYAYFPYLENHPDYIRYPFIILLYALLFLVGPQSAATIKIFNGILFLVNGVMVFVISLHLLERKKDSGLSVSGRNWLSALAAIMVSFILKNYFRYALSDEYEVPTITAMLVLILALTIIKRPFFTGMAQAVVYLCRSNMAVFAPFVWLYQIWGEKTFKERMRITLAYASAFLLVISPFFVRNFLLTGNFLFNYHQLIELYKGVIGTQSDLFNNFTVAPPLFPLEKTFIVNLLERFRSVIKDPFIFAARPQYFPGWIGIPFYLIRFKEDRNLLKLFLMGAIIHIILLSFFQQIERVYVPIFFILSIFGYLGILEWLASRLLSLQLSWLNNQYFLYGSLIFLVAICLVLVLPVVPNRSKRTIPPASEAIKVFRVHGIDCVYSNNPNWIPWYTDTYAIYKPTNNEDMLTKGPETCHYFFADKRLPYPSVFLLEHGTIIEEGIKFMLLELH